jgi:hypothetical protein
MPASTVVTPGVAPAICDEAHDLWRRARTVLAGRNAPEAAVMPCGWRTCPRYRVPGNDPALGEHRLRPGSPVTLVTLGLRRPVASGAVTARAADRRIGWQLCTFCC